MKQRFQGIVAGFLLAIICMGTVVFAATGQQSIKVTYNNIRLIFDGMEKTPKDAKGQVIEPFQYNGTTFVPLRFIADAFGKDVSWDGTAATVTIGGKSTTWLDELGAYNSDSTWGRSYTESIGEVSSNDREFFNRGLKFVQIATSDVLKKAGETETTVNEYLLDGQYSQFLGSAFSTRENGGIPSIIKIYGDNNLLYTSPGISAETKPVNISIDIKKVKVLRIEVSTKADWTQIDKNIIIGNARITK